MSAGPRLNKTVCYLPSNLSVTPMQNLIRFFNWLTIILVIAGFMVAASPAAAQSQSTQLDSLTVEMWPDYDRPSMLVLMTGTLPQNTPLPTTLTIPVPPGAEIHAVASFNATGALMSDVDYTVIGGQMTITTPSLRFRVEYYDPYQADGDRYTYTFNWQAADLSVANMSVVVQQPIAASDFSLTPAAVSSAAERGDGLTYHSLPARPVGAGELFTVVVAYTAAAPVLSAPSPEFALGDEPAPVTKTTTVPSAGIDPLWFVAAAVAALALIGGAWYLGRRQGHAASKARKPQPVRPAKTKPAKNAGGATRYCHQCGKPAQAGDTFCRHCGSQLKGD